jgi:hypothetical protein
MAENMDEKRRFMRHPTEVPIEVSRVQDASPRKVKRMKDISAGGLAFICTTVWEPGTSIRVRLPMVKPAVEATGRVVWCKKRQSYYEVGVSFSEPNDAFAVRMVEQLCQIEMYRKRQESEGRQISSEEAAMEWISRYAEDFSDKVEHWNDKIRH